MPHARALVPASTPAVLLALLTLLPGAARAATGEVRLLAHGSAEQYWIARVHEDLERGGGFLTDVYLRTAGDSAWHQVARVEGRAVDLAERGGRGDGARRGAGRTDVGHRLPAGGGKRFRDGGRGGRQSPVVRIQAARRRAGAGAVDDRPERRRAAVLVDAGWREGCGRAAR